MDPILSALFEKGTIGLVAAVFVTLYFMERKGHDATRDKYDGALKDRLADSQTNIKKITDPLDNISQSIKNLSDKIEISKTNNQGQ